MIRNLQKVPFRLWREDAELGCAEYDAAGKLTDEDRHDQQGIFTIVAGTADGELANWFCAAGQRTPMAGITALGTMTASSRFAAYKAGLGLVKQTEVYGR